MGIRIVREDVAQFISKRDGYPADHEDVILTEGGAQGIRVCKIGRNRSRDAIVSLLSGRLSAHSARFWQRSNLALDNKNN